MKTSNKKNSKKTTNTPKKVRGIKKGDKVTFKNRNYGRITGTVSHLRTNNGSTFAYVIDKMGAIFYPTVSKLTKK